MENRQYLVNMKAIGVEVMTKSVITFPLPCTVVLYRKSCIQNISILMQSNQYKYTEDLKYGDNQGHSIILR